MNISGTKNGLILLMTYSESFIEIQGLLLYLFCFKKSNRFAFPIWLVLVIFNIISNSVGYMTCHLKQFNSLSAVPFITLSPYACVHFAMCFGVLLFFGTIN